jgi:hypothetical protein
VVAVVAILWARLPQDEIAHPLRDDEDGESTGEAETPAGLDPATVE